MNESLNDDVMGKTISGRAALKKMGIVPENFRIYMSEYIGFDPKKPVAWTRMRVRGSQFQGQERRHAGQTYSGNHRHGHREP